jgi:hypothetical protein
MKKSEWGPIVWKVLHCITIKIKDEEFINQREKLIELITKICSNLPCPHCSSHAIRIINNYKLKYVKKKEDLIKFVHFMHNLVNKKTKKNTHSIEIIDNYKNYNTKNVLSDYYRMNTNYKTPNVKMMLHTHSRNEFLKFFYNYFNANISKFNQ